MKHIDITVDLETLSLSPNAAILQIAAVAWNRSDPQNPFIDFIPFEGFVDIRSCVIGDFDFEPHTIKWWARQKAQVQNAVLTPTAYPLKEVLESFARWLADIKDETGAESVCLWAQGSDFDIAILRNAFARYDLPFPIAHACFRDARTFVLEVGAFAGSLSPSSVVSNPEVVYSYFSLPDYVCGDVHNATHDARRTSFYVWRVLSLLSSRRTDGIVPVSDISNH